MSGVFTSRYPRRAFSRRRRSSSTFQRVMPFGCQKGEPGEASWRWKRSSCVPEPAVIVRPRLLEPLEIGVEVGLREERRAVDPGQLRVLLVAAPVGAGEPGQLDRLDRGRVLEVRAAAEIGEVALRVERDVALRGVDQLDLVRLSLGLEPRAGGVASDRLPRPRPALADLAQDLRLDRGEILLADRLRELEVVVEAVLDRGPDRDLHARDAAGARPRREDAPRSDGGRRARRDRRGCASSGSRATPRRATAAGGPGARRRRARARPARRASARSRGRHRARSPRREARARSRRGASRSCRARIVGVPRATRPCGPGRARPRRRASGGAGDR